MLIYFSTKKRTADRKGEIDDIYTSTKGLARQLDLPIWSVSQVNRTGAQDKIIEGDKAAGSYDKMMITDFAMSLSRKKEDKERGTGRFHIMKNRYGTDGLTFNVNADTATGHFVLSAYNEMRILKVRLFPQINRVVVISINLINKH